MIRAMMVCDGCGRIAAKAQARGSSIGDIRRYLDADIMTGAWDKDKRGIAGWNGIDYCAACADRNEAEREK